MTLAIVIAIATSLALTPLAKRLAWRFNAVSHPDGQRRLQSRPTPMWGGGSVYLALLLSVSVAYYLIRGEGHGSLLPAGLALSAGMLCILGAYDDLFELRARWKLLGQVAATVPIVLAGGCVHRLVLFGFSVELGALGIAFTIGWLVVGINALNLIDGMDGLASVVGIAVCVAIAAIAASQGQPAVLLLAVVLAGTLAGFLVYNLPPARIYLGDCGSMIIGATLALLALRVACDGPAGDSVAANLTVAGALLFVPFLDTGLAILRRTLQGSGMMVADRGHIHHRLLDRGFNVWQALALLGGLSFASGAIAWGVVLSGHEAYAWAALAVITVLLVHWQLAGHVEWNLARRFARETAIRIIARPPRETEVISFRTAVPPLPAAESSGDEVPQVQPSPTAAGDLADDLRKAA